MTDCINVPYAERHVDPDEAGLVAGYTFGEGELSTFGKYINRASTGAQFDLTTRVGTPLVGQGGGVYATNNSGSYLIVGPVATGVASFGYRIVHEQFVAPGGSRYILTNGAAAGHFFRHGATFDVSIDTLATWSAFVNAIGRGQQCLDIDYRDGVLHHYQNGRLLGSRACAAIAPAGNMTIGNHGTTTAVGIFNQSRGDAVVRASYVRDFARRVVYHWQPSIVGEGPAGGIPTGAAGEGDWYCPSGGASLAFVWRHSPGKLALTDSGALSMRRLSFMHTKMPAFGTWRFRFQLRDPATDNPRFGITAQRDQDFTAAGSDGYWWQVQRAAGVMQATMHEANGAAMLTVNSTAAGAADDDCEIVPTRAVNGDFRLWLRVGSVWAGSEATVANDVTSLSSNYVQVAPRQSYVTGIVRHQGEMTPAELP